MKKIGYALSISLILFVTLEIEAAEFAKQFGVTSAGVDGKAMARSKSGAGRSLIVSGSMTLAPNKQVYIHELSNTGSVVSQVKVYRTPVLGQDVSVTAADIASGASGSNDTYAIVGKYNVYQTSPDNNDAFIYAFNTTGNYQYRAGDGLEDKFEAIEPISDGYVVTGTHGTSTSQNLLVGVVNKTSGFVWLKSYNFFDNLNSVNLDDNAYDIAVVTGGYLVVGSTNVIGSTRRRGFVIKLDTSGNVSWFNTLQDTTRNIDFYSVSAISTGFVDDFIIYVSGSAGNDSFFANLGNNGNLQWYTCLDFASGDKVESSTIAGGLVGTIFTGSNINVVQLNTSNGAVNWAKYLIQTNTNYPKRMAVASDGDLLISAATTPASGNDNSVALKTTNNFGGLACSTNTLTYNTVSLNLSNNIQNTTIQSPFSVSSTGSDVNNVTAMTSVSDECP